jgi:hypothetical protein
MDDFHIAGVRCGAVEDFGRHWALSHFGGEIRVIKVRYTFPVPIIEEEIPEACFARLRFEALKDFQGSVAQRLFVFGVGRVVELLHFRFDLFRNEFFDLLERRLEFFRQLQIEQ